MLKSFGKSAATGASGTAPCNSCGWGCCARGCEGIGGGAGWVTIGDSSGWVRFRASMYCDPSKFFDGMATSILTEFDRYACEFCKGSGGVGCAFGEFSDDRDEPRLAYGKVVAWPLDSFVSPRLAFVALK